MALTVKLTSAGVYNRVYRLKANKVVIPSIDRQPIVVPLPGGSVLALDMGRKLKRITVTGEVDLVPEVLFIDTIVGIFTVGETVTTTRGANETTAIVTYVGGDRLGIVSGVYTNGPFINNEAVKGVTSLATAVVNEPLPRKLDLETFSDDYYADTLTLSHGSDDYVGKIKSLQCTQEAGKEDRYEFQLVFLVVTGPA